MKILEHTSQEFVCFSVFELANPLNLMKSGRHQRAILLYLWHEQWIISAGPWGILWWSASHLLSLCSFLSLFCLINIPFIKVTHASPPKLIQLLNIIKHWSLRCNAGLGKRCCTIQWDLHTFQVSSLRRFIQLRFKSRLLWPNKGQDRTFAYTFVPLMSPTSNFKQWTEKWAQWLSLSVNPVQDNHRLDNHLKSLSHFLFQEDAFHKRFVLVLRKVATEYAHLRWELIRRRRSFLV